ncbi:hypothetical protein HBB16_04395 [Pseudonocardia sp. MCCB 268]|nr:hypothetical protein [Pseudonocardia cytotoxica]
MTGHIARCGRPDHGGHEGRYYVDGVNAQLIPNVTDRKVYLPNTAYSTADVTRNHGTTTTGSHFTLNRTGLWSCPRPSASLATLAVGSGMRLSATTRTPSADTPAVALGLLPASLNMSTSPPQLPGQIVALWVPVGRAVP